MGQADAPATRRRTPGEWLKLVFYDTARLGRHESLLAFIKETRGQLDRAAVALVGTPDGIDKILALQAGQRRAIAGRVRSIQELDPDGQSSYLTPEHTLSLHYLADEYPAAVVGALRGDLAPLAEVRGELDRCQEKIEGWLADLRRRRDTRRARR